jgi:hypothetical protein
MRARQCIALMGLFEERSECIGKARVTETVRCDSQS